MNGKNIVGAGYVEAGTASFKATATASGATLTGDFYRATMDTVDEALIAAEAAHQSFKHIDKAKKAAFLRAIGAEILALGDELVQRAAAESGLPIARLQGEVGRTVGQLNLFATLVDEGSWVDATIDTALPDRQPMPRPDIRRMLVPIGPVVVFGASNFPLAFSVAGGDTASALAAGCPVIVKAHPAHLGTSAMVAAAIINAVQKSDVPAGVFSMLYDDGYEVGAALVKHPKTKAVAFTGSYKGGMALCQLAQQRPDPIPVFAEMGSINPVVLLPQALATKAEELAIKYAGSITLGAGQFCTNPGLLLAVQSAGLTQFKQALAKAIAVVPSANMLTTGICKNYQDRSNEILAQKGVALLAQSTVLNQELQNQSVAKIAEVSAADFLANPALQEEIFGPYSLLVVANDVAQLGAVADALQGQLTVTFMAENNELKDHAELVDKLSDKTGRLILNGVPTGVEVSSAMQHGGPFPAASDSRFTSVGSTAVYRFVRPVAWQDWDDALLPDALKRNNPLGIFRKIDQSLAKH